MSQIYWRDLLGDGEILKIRSAATCYCEIFHIVIAVLWRWQKWRCCNLTEDAETDPWQCHKNLILTDEMVSELFFFRYIIIRVMKWADGVVWDEEIFFDDKDLLFG